MQNNGSLYLHAVFEAEVIQKTEEEPLGTLRTLEWIRTWRECPLPAKFCEHLDATSTCACCSIMHREDGCEAALHAAHPGVESQLARVPLF